MVTASLSYADNGNPVPTWLTTGRWFFYLPVAMAVLLTLLPYMRWPETAIIVPEPLRISLNLVSRAGATANVSAQNANFPAKPVPVAQPLKDRVATKKKAKLLKVVTPPTIIKNMSAPIAVKPLIKPLIKPIIKPTTPATVKVAAVKSPDVVPVAVNVDTKPTAKPETTPTLSKPEQPLASADTDARDRTAPEKTITDSGQGKTKTGQGRSAATLVHQARYRSQTPPTYPRRALKLGQQGLVILHARVLPSGQPGDIKIEQSSGHRLLDKAALAAVKRWRFEPVSVDGRYQAAWMRVPVNFKIR